MKHFLQFSKKDDVSQTPGDRVRKRIAEKANPMVFADAACALEFPVRTGMLFG
jgi:hypothetical protein